MTTKYLQGDLTMEIIIVVAVLVGIALWWGNHVRAEKSRHDNDLDNWTPPKAEDERWPKDKLWPYGEKVAEGKIHVKPADVAPEKSEEDRVETPAPTVSDVTAENKAEAVAKVKKAPAKKTAAAKKAPAKKSSS
jgi:hypothetical protein